MKADNYVKKLGKDELFRHGEKIYVNRSDEFEHYMGVLHSHDFIEISYVISGRGIHILGDDSYTVSTGDLFVISGDVTHGFFPLDKVTKPPVVYNVVFTSGFLDENDIDSAEFKELSHSSLLQASVPDNIESLSAKPYISFSGVRYDEIGNIFEKMHKEYRFRKKGYCDILRAHLVELIVKILRFMLEPAELNDSFANISEKHRKMIEYAINYINRNYPEDISLDELSLQIGISKSHFSRIFKMATGQNYINYLMNVRIEEACRLLRTSEYNISDIALMSGFKDIKHFYEIFRRYTGMTPKEYRDSKSGI